MGLAVTGAPSAMQSKLEIRKPFLQADDSGVRRSWHVLMCDGRHNLLASALVPGTRTWTTSGPRVIVGAAGVAQEIYS